MEQRSLPTISGRIELAGFCFGRPRERGLKPSNESFEVVLARPIAAGRANQTSAWEVTDDNALLGQPVDEGLRVLGPPGDQSRLVRLGNDVRAVFEKQRAAALSRLPGSVIPLRAGLRRE